jgi:hypothetical protein
MTGRGCFEGLLPCVEGSMASGNYFVVSGRAQTGEMQTTGFAVFAARGRVTSRLLAFADVVEDLREQ